MLEAVRDKVVVADGDYGPFAGNPRDEVVFGGYLRTRTWAPELVRLLSERLLSQGGTFLDVGANIGLVTVPVLERTSACAIAFEPEPNNFALLRENLARHGLLARALTHACALSDGCGSAELLLSRDNSGDHRLVTGARGSALHRIAVRTETLEALLGTRSLPRPIVMKLDCQGAEVRVLRGAGRFLRQVDSLVLEYWPAGLRRMGDHANDLPALLSCFPWGVYLPGDRPHDSLQPASALFASLSWIATDGSDEGFFDLLFTRRHDR